MNWKSILPFKCVVLVPALIVAILMGYVADGETHYLAIDVSTNKGEVVGSDTGTMNEFLGIPYAAPPTGANRWKAPQPHAAWTVPLEATQFANHCPQNATPFGSASNTAEDCLYLNVYTPLGPQQPIRRITSR